MTPDRAALGWRHAPALPAATRPRTPDGRPLKITFGEMREMGLSGVLVFCPDYRCSHSLRLPADRWADEVRLSDIEPRFVCAGCGNRGADVRPDFESGKPPQFAKAAAN
ncbi:hypothetical protein [Bradyrhizobium sp. CCBAU 51765]|uniref:hypothetical protein n=1 Tax=Bradyrhizobium sp. CCBAU 51765 TaxID=1325102 RepID=UPI001FEDB44F|nr:hypothetical protein [Bradyrhizobium sp. CCBAU 51765]